MLPRTAGMPLPPKREHMPIFARNGRRVAFIHIPKAAGSSIERHFEQSGWQMEYYQPCKTPWEPALHHLTYVELRELVEDLDEIPSFCIVRNPFKRMVSEWRWQRTAMRSTLLNFPDFVHRVDVSLKSCKTYWDNHWRPQSDFFDENIDNVMHLESLDKDFSAFLDQNGLEAMDQIPRIGRSKLGGRFPRLTVNDEALGRVRKIYRDDFELFGYSPEAPPLK